jgi:hypothetical protein
VRPSGRSDEASHSSKGRQASSLRTSPRSRQVVQEGYVSGCGGEEWSLGCGWENETDTQSDVEDLLPPLASRAGMRSIEDEERDQLATIGATKERDRNMEREVPQTSSPSALSSGIPHSSSSSSTLPNSISSNTSTSASPLSNSNSMTTPRNSWIPLRWRRLSDMEWVKKNGWADKSGNVIIWGAPNVDNIGRMGDRADIKGKRGL